MTATEQLPDLTALSQLETDMDVFFDVLSSDRRRFVLASLHGHDDSMTLRDLTHEIATSEYNTIITNVPAKTLKSISVSLHHCHIPKMDNLDVVDYRKNRRMVELTQTGEELVTAGNLSQS